MAPCPSNRMNRLVWPRKPFGAIWPIISILLLLSGGHPGAFATPSPDDDAEVKSPIAREELLPDVIETSASEIPDDESAPNDDALENETAGDGALHTPDNQDDQASEESDLDFISFEYRGREFADRNIDTFVGPPLPQDSGDVAPPIRESKPPIAENIDLSEPIAPIPDVDGIDIGRISPPLQPKVAVYKQKSLLMLGAEVPAGTSTRLAWSPDQSFEGIAVPTPVLVVNGAKPGPVLCLTAAIHGDELNGIEVVRRVLYDLEPEKLSGTVIGIPIVNLQGFRRSSRYLPDRRDLNRFFPGNARGSAAARLAYSFFNEVIANCGALVDMHTGSFQRTNLPQLRADLNNPKVVELTERFGSTVVLHSSGTKGTLRRAASDAGIPSVTVEAGEPSRVQDNDVTHSTKGVMTLLNELGMYEKTTSWGKREPVYFRSKWVRAESGGVLFSKVSLGDRVRKGELLGTITDPITNVQSELRASVNGRILGMALDQFVMPGFASFRIGIEKQEVDALSPASIADEIDGGPDSRTLADDADGEAINEYEDESELLDERDNFEDSE